MPTQAEYQHAFRTEQAQQYPSVTDFEAEVGYAISPAWLEEAARVLACPVKANPPNWQHGRVLYARARRLIADLGDLPYMFVDIGTAKGFSALVLCLALGDAKAQGRVLSFDVIDPGARVRRNTVAEVKGLLTLHEVLAPWQDRAERIEFYQGSADLSGWGRCHLAFIDGKHTRDAVMRDIAEVRPRQLPGDAIMFDDVQLGPVADAAATTGDQYRDRRWMSLPPPLNRQYLLVTRTR